MKMVKDKVLIKVDERKRVTDGGIILVDEVDASVTGERLATGDVTAIGPGSVKSPMVVKVGDKVVFDFYDGENIDGDDEHRVLHVNDIWGVIVDEGDYGDE